MKKTIKILGITLCLVLIVLALKIAKTGSILKKGNIAELKTANNKIRFIKTEDIEIANDKLNVSPATCLKLESEDGNLIHTSIAINDKYLAIGEPEGNKVSIYSHDGDGSWIKKREILPPTDSIAYKVNSGFGSLLELDRNLLIIGAYTQQLKSKIDNPDEYQITDVSTLISQAIYKVDLSQKSRVERINIPSNNIIDFDSITVDKNKIAFITSSKKSLEKKKINVFIEKNNKLTNFEIPLPIRKKEYAYDNFDMEIKNNLLLLGYPSYYEEGSGLLFDTNFPTNQPIKLAAHNAIIGQTVALSNQFAVVSALSFGQTVPIDTESLPEAKEKTLIRNINSGSTTVIDGNGEVFLFKNILLRAFLKEDYLIAKNRYIVEIYYLDDDATPYLIEKRTNTDASVQNGFLVTSRRTAYGKKICTEKIN